MKTNCDTDKMEVIQMQPNDVYGITDHINTTPTDVYGISDHITTTPNVVYGTVQERQEIEESFRDTAI